MSTTFDLLVLLCGDRKNDDHRLMPAMCRYQGTNFNVLRSELRTLQGRPKRYPFREVLALVPEWLDIYIISGVYGLIRYDRNIPYYDSGGVFSQQIRGQVLKGLAAIKESKGHPVHLAYVGGEHPIGEMLLYLDRMYPQSDCHRYMGRPGEQAHALKVWIDHVWWHRTGDELDRDFDYQVLS